MPTRGRLSAGHFEGAAAMNGCTLNPSANSASSFLATWPLQRHTCDETSWRWEFEVMKERGDLCNEEG